MSVGSELLAARTVQKRTIRELSDVTKIQPWVLEALESNRLRELMSPIYVKGFLTTYAKTLGLDPKPLLAELALPSPHEEEELPPPAPRIPMMRFPWPTIRFRLSETVRTRLAIGLVGVVVLAIWLRPKDQDPAETTVDVHLASIAPGFGSTKTPELPFPTLGATAPLELALTAYRATWVQVRADGKLVAQRRVRRGSRETWRAEEQLDLIIANPTQVDLTLNGQSISPFVVAHHGRLSITRQGIVQLATPE